MKIIVRVTPRARHNAVKEEGGVLKVHTTAPALEGRANEAVVEIVARHLGVRRSQVEVIKGLKSKNKVINIKD